MPDTSTEPRQYKTKIEPQARRRVGTEPDLNAIPLVLVPAPEMREKFEWPTKNYLMKIVYDIGGDATKAVDPNDLLARLPWFEQAIEQDKKGRYVAALNLVFRWVDDMLCEHRFAAVDAWLKSVAINDVSSHLIVGILSITRPAANHLESRELFFEAAWESLRNRGKDVHRLLNGLRGRRRADGNPL